MMASVVKFVGKNKNGEFGAAKSSIASELVDAGINKFSQRITQILLCDEFVIYSDDQYKNVYTAGGNFAGRCATNNFKEIETFRPDGFYHLTFFKEKNIKIKKICANHCSKSVFWITESGKVYANGYNYFHQLGIKNNYNQCTPVLIQPLTNVIDVRNNGTYSIALCNNQSQNTHIIIGYWIRTRITTNELPPDIIHIVIKYYTINKVLSCGFSTHGAHGHGDKCQIEQWTEIKALKGKNIMKIRTGLGQSYFLDSQGSVFVCGVNGYGQLGLSSFQTPILNITRIEYFIKNNIKIKEVECGYSHVIMMDYNNRIYTFGCNNYAQTGAETDENVNEPKELIMFRDLKVEQIKTGRYHSYVKCDGDKHYIWGDNEYNECMVGKDANLVKTPHLLDLKGMNVQDVILGYDNTAFIVSKK